MSALPDSYRALLAARFKTLREDAGISLQQAADAIGANRDTVEALEDGRFEFSLERLVRWCLLYKQKPDDVLGEIARIVLEAEKRPTRFDALLLFCGVTPQYWVSGQPDIDRGAVEEFDPVEVAAAAGLSHRHPRRKAAAHMVRLEYEKGRSVRELMAETGLAFGTVRSMVLGAGAVMRSPGGVSGRRKTT